jgi:hypothetical protein
MRRLAELARTHLTLDRLVLLTLSTLVSLLAAELALRAIDGYRLLSLRLVPARLAQPAVTPSRGNAEEPLFGGDLAADTAYSAPYAARVPLAPGVLAGWYKLDPPPHARAQSDNAPYLALMEEAAKRGARDPSMAGAIWNSHWLATAMCKAPGYPEMFAAFPPEVLVFDPVEPSVYPNYRRPYRAHHGRLFTNQWGLRGPELALLKPAGTIRIAFVGASTTEDNHSFPFTYPEFVANWLNVWARARGLEVAFEAINAGRSGINSNGIRAVLEHEVLALAPDYVVYYEGSNEFWPNARLSATGRRIAKSRPIAANRQEAAALDHYYGAFPAANHSAIARRLFFATRPLTLQGGAEPPKPSQALDWPKRLDPADPDLALDPLPLNLSRIVRNLRDMQRRTEASGGRFVLSSFVWLVSDGLVLDTRRDVHIYRYLNEMFWPWSYDTMRRSADLQNAVLAKLARTGGMPFLGIDRQYPRDPRLFIDAIHMSYGGVRLRAWVVLNDLLPFVAADLASGRYPRADARTITQHPGFGPVRLMRHGCPPR